jgi:hypothetical protein
MKDSEQRFITRSDPCFSIGFSVYESWQADRICSIIQLGLRGEIVGGKPTRETAMVFLPLRAGLTIKLISDSHMACHCFL